MRVQDGAKYADPKVLELVELVEQCLRAIQSAIANSDQICVSEATGEDYLALVQTLQKRAESTGSGLISVIQSTARTTTFYKRVAALRYHCLRSIQTLGAELPQATNEATATRLHATTKVLLGQIQVLATLQQQGFTQPRRKRASKRQALRGLPPNWRTELYKRGANGKYGMALLVSALTGARPSELAKGIEIWKAYDDSLGKYVLCFDIRGAKVSALQGQPNRFMSYAIDDNNPLVKAMVQRLHEKSDSNLRVDVRDSGNFTVEVRRLARSLWPKHKQAITAYCFRHQWSADVKANGNAGAVSKGLGHLSAKTRRYYGTANQASSADRLWPQRIDAVRPVNTLRAFSYSIQTASSLTFS